MLNNGHCNALTADAPTNFFSKASGQLDLLISNQQDANCRLHQFIIRVSGHFPENPPTTQGVNGKESPSLSESILEKLQRLNVLIEENHSLLNRLSNIA